jgi:hypothetical protein
MLSMRSSSVRNLTTEAAQLAASWRRDPARFVREAFPWGEPGPLQAEPGPDDWQQDILTTIGEGLSPQKASQIAVASGHGPGKTALVAWIILWAMLTEADTRGVVTANTESQLRTKTWAELAKWFRLCPLLTEFFILTATTLAARDPAHAKTWRIDAVPWTENRVEAFAGLHNQGRRILVVFDEASAIPDLIWETTEGALTDEMTEILWLVCGNPTRNNGRFRECFGRYRHRWIRRQVDSRNARITNKQQIAQWIADYGDESDFVRVRVKGEFPRASSMQFIASDIVEAAMTREATVTVSDPFVMGVDVARFGDDRTVIVLRRGRDARSVSWIKLTGADTMTVAAKVAEIAQQHRPDAIFIDGGGPGGGVVDRLRQLQHTVFDVQFGGKADHSHIAQDGAIVYANKRAEMWGAMRAWLAGGMIPDDRELLADLTGVEYGYALREGRDAIILEKKEDMKRRGLASPDLADALALTFAYPVAAHDHSWQLTGKPRHQYQYDPFQQAWSGRL